MGNILIGYTFVEFGSCKVAKCSNARIGEYYTGSSSIGTFNQCPVAKCASPAPGKQFLSGAWNVEMESCRTEGCDQVINAGYYYTIGCNTTRCSNAPSDLVTYYLGPGINQDSNTCPYAVCTNAISGQRYTKSAKEFSNNPTCEVEPCPLPIAGYGAFFEPGTCKRQYCVNALPGQYYSSNGTSFTDCDTDQCTNIRDDSFYIRGFANSSDACPLYDCGDPPPLGYLINLPGCSYIDLSTAH